MAVAIADLMATTEDDLARAKPLVDEAAEQLARGQGIPADQALTQIRKSFDR